MSSNLSQLVYGNNNDESIADIGNSQCFNDEDDFYKVQNEPKDKQNHHHDQQQCSGILERPQEVLNILLATKGTQRQSQQDKYGEEKMWRLGLKVQKFEATLELKLQLRESGRAPRTMEARSTASQEVHGLVSDFDSILEG